ncbi:ABC transporter permease [Lentilactobacillus kosonis]|uniref:Transport permease protein n=1 Tax=Lentilactobacillus kosonis TaxID=2810561 RepID=A0A401FHT1_9LACO|nr:ABC transporter permease [Lentilactobacillus kosonis]GAY71930.1 ABC transporter, permease protein [Lentilactobacillus kosonis]
MQTITAKPNVLKNTGTMVYRNLLKTIHNPERFMDVIIQPIMLMLLFGYLFGGAIAGGVTAYLPTIVPGILVQTMISAASGSATQIREDLDTGVFDRFKSLPIAHIAPLAGQLFADILRLMIATVSSLATGYAMGWRPAVGFQWVLAAAALAIFIGWSLSWVFALIGLLVKSATFIQSLSTIVMMLLSFMSNAFVPTNTLPHFMQILANANPVSFFVIATKSLLINGSWSQESLVVLAFGVGTVVITLPLTLWAYNHNN